MDQLAELRKQRHLEYLQKREQEQKLELERQELERIEKEQRDEYERLNPKVEVEDEEINEEQEHEDGDYNEDQIIPAEPLPGYNNNNMEDEEDNNEDNEEEFDEDEEEEEFNQPQPPIFPPIFNAKLPPNFPPNFNFNNAIGGFGNHHFGGHQPFQSYSGQGHQLSSANNNPSGSPFYEPPVIEPSEPTTGEEKRETFLNSIESRYTKSPELVSVNKEIEKQAKANYLKSIPKEYKVKKLVDLCLSKMTIELTLFQSQLKLMSGELIQRLIELMVSQGRLTRTKMNQIIASGARIYSLDLSHQYAVVNNDFLLNCFKYMVEVQSVYFRNCANITDNGMEVFRLNNFERNLKILDIRDNRITDVGIRNIKNLVNLEELYLGNTTCSDIGFALLSKLVNLKTLDISKCKITDSSMDIISRFVELRSLNLSGTQITDTGISKISKLPNLIQLYLSNCLYLSNQSLFFLSYLGKTLKLLDLHSTTKIGLNGFIHLKNLKQLTSLVLPGRDSINDSTIVHLNVLSNLRMLDLSDYIYLTDISPLTGLQNLTELLLSNTKVDDRSIINSIKTMNSLQVLSLNRTEVTNEGVSQLMDLDLQSLSLSSTKIDGHSLLYLGQMKSLQNLNISFNNISDKHMDHLIPIASTLSSLDLRGTDTFRSLSLFPERIVRPPVAQIVIENNNNEDDEDEDPFGN